MIWRLVLVLIVASPALAQDDGARQRDELVARLERLRDEAAAAEARQRTLGEEAVELAGDEAKLREKRDEAAQKVAALETRVVADEATLERLTDGQARLRQQLSGKRQELATILAALQRIGRRSPPALLSDDGDPTDVVRGAIVINAVLPRLDASVQALASDLAEASRLEDEERARWARLRDDLATLEDERGRLDRLGAELERRRALSTFERDRATQEVVRLAQEAGTVEGLIDRVTGGAGAGPPAATGFAARRGKLAAPVAGTVVAEYGEPTEGGGTAEGRTLAALPGSTVFAPVEGGVLFSAPFRGYGHVLILDAGEGYHLVLAGLEQTSVTVGEQVTVGTPLGRMGRAGRRSTVASAGVRGSALIGARPALYVEIRKDGSAIDSHGWWREATVANVGADGGRTGG